MATLPQPPERQAQRDRRRGLPARLPAAARTSSARLAWSWRPRRSTDGGTFRLLQGAGRRQEGQRRGDQEGLPQARSPVPPGPQPGRRQGRGALQGDLPGLRRARRPREAQAVRQRQRAVRPGGRARCAASAASATSTSTPPRWGTSCPTCSAVPGRRRQARPRARPEPNAAPTSRHRCRSPSTRPSPGAQVPLQVPMRTTCDTCHGTGAAPGHLAHDLPPLRRPGHRDRRARGCSPSPSRARSAEARGRSSRTPARRAAASGTVRTVKRLRVNIPAGVRDGSRIRLAGKGEPGRGAGRRATCT